MDQGSTVNTANDNNKLLLLQAAPTTGKSTPVVSNRGKWHGLPNSSTCWDYRQAHSCPVTYPWVTMVTCFWGERRLVLGWGMQDDSWEGTKKKNSITIFASSLPMSPHTPQPNINLLSPPKTYTGKSWLGTSLQRPRRGGGLPTHPVVLPWDLRWKQSCSTWNSSVQELECYIDSVKRYKKS